jgi:hypothetical protein
LLTTDRPSPITIHFLPFPPSLNSQQLVTP